MFFSEHIVVLEMIFKRHSRSSAMSFVWSPEHSTRDWKSRLHLFSSKNSWSDLESFLNVDQGHWQLYKSGKDKGKGLDTCYSSTYMSGLVTSSALQSRKWQLIGMSQWCCSALCGHSLPALTDNLTHGAASRHTIPPISHTRPSLRSRRKYRFWDIQRPMSLKSGLRVIQHQWKWHHSMDHIRLPTSPPL